MRNSRVSIVITCFNYGRWLPESLNSALAQTYPNTEIIIMDDGSTDEGTIDVLKEIDAENYPNVTVVHRKNAGVATARNEGIKLSKGEYICCLDADDVLEPEYVSELVKLFDGEKVGFVTSWVSIFGEKNGIWKTDPNNLVRNLWSNSIHVASMFSRKAWELVNGYETKIIPGFADWDLWLSMIEAGYKGKVVKRELFKYRVKLVSMITEAEKSRVKAYNYILHKHERLYKKHLIEFISDVVTTKDSEIKNMDSLLQSTRKDYELVLNNFVYFKKLSEEYEFAIKEKLKLIDGKDVEISKLTSLLEELASHNAKLQQEAEQVVQGKKLLEDEYYEQQYRLALVSRENTIHKQELEANAAKIYKIITRKIYLPYKFFSDSLVFVADGIKIFIDYSRIVIRSIKDRILWIRFLLTLFISKLQKKRIVSFDVFDTILRRSIYPEEIKLRAANYLFLRYHSRFKYIFTPLEIYQTRVAVESEIAKDNIKLGLDGEYAISEVWEKVLRYSLGVSKKDRDKICNDLVSFELEEERGAIRLDSIIQNVLKLLNPEKAMFISDIYYDSEKVHDLLGFVGIDSIDGISSCDVKLNKASGRLYDYVHRNKHLDKNEWLHIGDSKLSDVAAARSSGIKPLWYFNLSEELKKRALAERWFRIRGRYYDFNDELNDLLLSFESPKEFTDAQVSLYRLGARMSPMYYFFIKSIIQDSIRRGVDTFHYCTREGEFFQKVHEVYVDNIKHYTRNMPKAVLLEVSRLSTFAPSLGKVSRDSLMRMWSQYALQSPVDFCASLGIDEEKFHKYFEEVRLKPKKKIDMIASKKMSKLLESEAFIKSLQTEIDNKRKHIFKYLESKGIDHKTDENMLMVDIGWKGSIQDNIAHLLPNKTVHGWYFGLFRSINVPPKNVTKDAFGPNYWVDLPKQMELIANTGILEMISNGPGGSVTEYQPDKKGNVKALRKPKSKEDVIFWEYTQYFQAGVLDAIPKIAKWDLESVIDPGEIRSYVFDLLEELNNDPNPVLVEAFFNLHHDETFGVGGVYDMSQNSVVGRKDKLLMLISRRKRQEVMERAMNSFWKNGFWVKNRLYGIRKLIRKFATRI